MTAGWGENSRHRGLGRQRPAAVRRRPRSTWVRNGRDPLDDLMSRQLPSGGFRWRDSDTTENALGARSTRSGRSAAPASRPTRRAAARAVLLAPPEVADGTEVPVGVVVDYGVAVRACSVRARTGAPLRDGRSRPRHASASGGPAAWTIAHRDDSRVVRAGDVIALRAAIAGGRRARSERVVRAARARRARGSRRRASRAAARDHDVRCARGSASRASPAGAAGRCARTAGSASASRAARRR